MVFRKRRSLPVVREEVPWWRHFVIVLLIGTWQLHTDDVLLNRTSRIRKQIITISLQVNELVTHARARTYGSLTFFTNDHNYWVRSNWFYFWSFKNCGRLFWQKLNSINVICVDDWIEDAGIELSQSPTLLIVSDWQVKPKTARYYWQSAHKTQHFSSSLITFASSLFWC